MDPLWSKYPPALTKWWKEYYLPKYQSLNSAAYGPGTKLASWNCNGLAVLPGWRRKGVGSALIGGVQREMLTRGKGEVMIVEAAKEKNLMFYHSVGFKTRATAHYESEYGAFTMWALMFESEGNEDKKS
ncbi:hypothetical protein K435DRAFT_416157 [Dendrothele bispora CBS 962.96]|uniref:N-acetyltransferase domain-containing protein n=1 Tax=Dendrothele bispora (strain CBS 962.96) TaxID=1314807 RepID=A0A4S8MUZ3_DENBC|nr:hypothetical protein K435DRAFT_416157 [Dendrothele bispora CBS 962.96]